MKWMTTDKHKEIVDAENKLNHAKSYLRGLEGTRACAIHWIGVKTGRVGGDARSMPKINVPALIKQISRVKTIIHNMEKNHESN